MVTLNLDKIFHPKSVAIIGASDEEGTVGCALMKKMGFATSHAEDGNIKGTLDLKEEEVSVSREPANTADPQVVQVPLTRTTHKEAEAVPSS